MWISTRTATGVALGLAGFGAISRVVVLTTARRGGARERADAPDLDEISLGDMFLAGALRSLSARGKMAAGKGMPLSPGRDAGP